MNQLLQEIQRTLADLLQSGLATGGAPAVHRLRELSARCEETGLHTGSALLEELAAGLSARAHTLEKEDLSLSAVLCRAVHYVEFCREKLQEASILQRWQAQQEDLEQGGKG